MKRKLMMALVLFAAPAGAQTLEGMAGDWTGSGTARQLPDSAQETMRCRLSNSFADDTLTIDGRCAVPGQQFTLSGRLNEAADGRLTGIWRNPTGPGQTSVTGTVADDAIFFTFRADDPDTGTDISQIVRMRIRGGQLSLRSEHRQSRQLMSEATFTR
ncbi:MAG: hypothetical protein RI571_12655 [Roseovarius sp.]|nr:hypothetical protein [Roseovarius sp.]